MVFRELQEGAYVGAGLGRVRSVSRGGEASRIRPGVGGVAKLLASVGHAGSEARARGPDLEQGRDLGPADEAALARGGDRDVLAQQRPAQGLEQCVCAGQHRLPAPQRTGPVAMPHGSGQHRGLVGSVADGDRGVVARRSRRGLGRPAQDPARRGQHLGRGPEVGPHVQHRAPTEMLADAADQFGISAVPPVDGLVGIAYHHQRRVRAQPRPQQGELQRVDVLELVDEHVLVKPPVSRGVLRLGRHQLQGPGQHVVEVEQPALALGRLVVGVDLGEAVGSAQRMPPARSARRLGVVLGGHEASLAPADLVADVGHGRAVGPGPQFGDQACDVVEDPGRASAGVGRMATKLGESDSVEGPGSYRVIEAESPQAGPQLAGRPAGESHRQGAPGVGVGPAGLPGDAPGQDTGLA